MIIALHDRYYDRSKAFIILTIFRNLIQSQTQQVGSLDRNKSALELSSADSSFPPTAAAGLRKSSSVANYNLIPRDTKDTHAPILPEKTHLTPFVSHLFGHGHSSSHNSHHNIR